MATRSTRKGNGTTQRRQVNRLPAERRIADIMDAARAIFSERGYSDALISDIADRAGVVEGSIYRFFKNKRDLLIRVVEAWYEEMLSEDQEIGGVRGTRNRIRVIIYRHLVSIHTDPALSRLFLQELRPDPTYRQTRLFTLSQSYANRVIDVVREAVKTGEFRADIQPTLVRDMIFGTIEHRTWAYLRGEGDFDVEETADAITEIIYNGLKAPDRADTPQDRTIARLETLAERLEAVQLPRARDE